MKKLYFFLVAMVVSIVANAAATLPASSLYMIGELTGGWSADKGTQMTGNDGVFTLEVTATTAGTKYFGFTTKLGSNSGDWDTYNGNRLYPSGSSKVTLDAVTNLSATRGGDESWNITVTAGTTYTVEVNTNDKTFTISEAGSIDIPEFEGGLVYFKKPASWKTPKCHYWPNGSTWPGKEMTLVTGTTDVYSISLPKGVEGFLFTDKNEGGNQTSDITYPNMVVGDIYQADGSHTKYDGGDVFTFPALSIYGPGGWVKPHNMTENNGVYTYTFAEGELKDTQFRVGIQMDEVVDGQQFTYSFGGASEITADGDYTLTQGAGNVVVNLPGVVTFTLTTTEASFASGGTATLKVTSVAFPENLYLLGNMVNGEGWNLTDGNAVAKGDNGVYTFSKVLVEAPEESEVAYVQFATVLGGTWAAVNNGDRFGAAEADAALTVGEANAVTAYPVNVSAMACKAWTIAPGTYDITVDLDNMTVTPVAVDAFKFPALAVYGPGSWITAHNMTESNGVYTVAFDADELKDTQFRIGVQMEEVVDGQQFTPYSFGGAAEISEAGVVTLTQGAGNVPVKLEGIVTFTLSTTAASFDNGGTAKLAVSINAVNPDVVYFDNGKAQWNEVYVYLWTDEGESTQHNEWPGKLMTKGDNDVWSYTVPADLGFEPANVIFNNGKAGDQEGGAQTEDLVYEAGKTYTYDPNPAPAYPEVVYLMGHVNGYAWAPDKGVAVSGENGVYTWANVTIDNSGDGYGYISFATALAEAGTTGAEAWGAVNSSNRYGAATADEVLEDEVAGTVVLYAVNIDASDCKSFKVAAGGYKVVLDLASMGVTVFTGTGIDSVGAADGDVAPVYYNLQGVRVADPANGVYIVVRGDKVTKEYVR